MDPNHDQMLREIYRLTQDNNRMLHAMRRGAFISALIKWIFWLALLIIPWWLYMQYLAPVMQDLLKAMNQAQGTSVQAQTQLAAWQKAFQEIQSKIPSFFAPSSTTK